MDKTINYLNLTTFRSNTTSHTQALLDADKLLQYWQLNKSQYAGFDRDFYTAPCYCWFAWEKDKAKSKRMPGRAPLAFELPRVGFNGKELNFTNGRNRVHWLIGQGLSQIPVLIRKYSVEHALSADLISKLYLENGNVVIPCFDYDNADRCGTCSGNCV